MKDSASSINCGLSEHIVAYMYGEVPSSEVQAFETHLADCQTCIDEFAELSASRYEVYEWRKLEFDQLESPQISIPYETVSILDRIRVIWAFSPKWAFGGTALTAAAILIAFVLGSQFLGKNELSAVEEPKVIVPAAPEPLHEVIAGKPLIEKQHNDLGALRPQPAKTIAVKVSTERPSRPRPAKPSRAQRTVPVRQRPGVVPQLNDFPEEIDESLRLAELFDDIETE